MSYAFVSSYYNRPNQWVYYCPICGRYKRRRFKGSPEMMIVSVESLMKHEIATVPFRTCSLKRFVFILCGNCLQPDPEKHQEELKKEGFGTAWG